ncbi:hypothetical protein NQ318_001612 [Aromia moschata]|uniref:Phospholipase A2-like domain-containing protein n=1 Tax=Aromia moschata TaxID=1265417 RepID=A0AAV8Y3D8_9CUCU|nr:hypothetical protein NQ318_001612 [Aromia moschata]
MGKRKNISSIIRRKTPKKGRGLLNTLINKLPVELHIPGYRYCGPGTKLEKRLERGDQGVNPLDEACKVHDIAYSQFKDTTSRNIADRELAEAATKRLKASDARLGEKIAAFGVANIMKAKSALGGGAAGIAKAVNDSKANRQQLEEEKRHNLAMEAAATGKGLYLAPYKKGYGLYLSPNRKNYQ